MQGPNVFRPLIRERIHGHVCWFLIGVITWSFIASSYGLSARRETIGISSVFLDFRLLDAYGINDMVRAVQWWTIASVMHLPLCNCMFGQRKDSRYLHQLKFWYNILKISNTHRLWVLNQMYVGRKSGYGNLFLFFLLWIIYRRSISVHLSKCKKFVLEIKTNKECHIS